MTKNHSVSYSFFILLFTLFICTANITLAEKRVALVIGNSNYINATKLINPQNDATAIAAALANLGFEVIEGFDLNERQTLHTFNKFRNKINAADVALLFYAGHGLQVGGTNYLIPTDATLGSELDLQAQAMRLDVILGMMENPNRTSIVLLDACRDNPLARRLSRSMGTRSSKIGRGLARIETGLGTYIGFSTEPGSVALDGEGKHSPFAQALLNNIGRKNQDIESIMRLVRAEVYKNTNGNQIPWGNSSLIGKGFVFNNYISDMRTGEAIDATPGQDNSATEIAYWNSIKDAKSSSYFQAYIDQFPHGRFITLAKLKFVEIAGKQKNSQLQKPANSQQLVVAKLDHELVAEEPNKVVNKETIRSIQKELNRLGCSAGFADGLWGKGSRSALRKYSRYGKIKLAALEPTVAILDQLKARQSRVCPLVCRSGFEKKNERCVRIKREARVKRDAPPKQRVNKKSKIETKIKKKTSRISNSICFYCRATPSIREGRKCVAPNDLEISSLRLHCKRL